MALVPNFNRTALTNILSLEMRLRSFSMRATWYAETPSGIEMESLKITGTGQLSTRKRKARKAKMPAAQMAATHLKLAMCNGNGRIRVANLIWIEWAIQPPVSKCQVEALLDCT